MVGRAGADMASNVSKCGISNPHLIYVTFFSELFWRLCSNFSIKLKVKEETINQKPQRSTKLSDLEKIKFGVDFFVEYV